MGALEGRVAVVTGGGSGIGRAASIALARCGACVVVANRREPEGEETVALITRAGGQAAFKRTDLRDVTQIRELFDFAPMRFGLVSIGFNNAGFQEHRAPFTELEDGVYEDVFTINVRAVFLCMKHEIRQMLQIGGGAIINNASVSGVRNPNPGLALYSASKGAVISLTKSAAMEYGPAKIRVNAVSPGRVQTPMMLNSGIADMAEVARGLPLRRLGDPEEVAAAVVWLASTASSFVTGHVLTVDGGFLAA